MKKFLFILLAFFIAPSILLFASCTGRYDNLSMSATFSYNENDATTLSNGVVRVSNSNGTFDINRDGSYTLYRSSEKNTRIYLDVTFSGQDASFAYGATCKLTNEIVSISSSYSRINDGIRMSMTTLCEGQSVLTVNSSEGGKSASIRLRVENVSTELSFKQETLALVNKASSSINLLDNINSSNKSDITFSLGKMVNDEFEPFPASQVYSNNLNVSQSGVLSILGTKTTLNSIYVKAVCDAPLNYNLVSYAEIMFLPELENFNVYYGKFNTDIIEENLVGEKTTNLIINSTNDSSTNIILCVDNAGQEVDFSIKNKEDIVCSVLQTAKYYLTSEGIVTANVEESTKCYAVYLVSAERTSETSAFSGGICNIVFECNYKNYSVSSALESSMPISAYEIVKNYLVDGVMMNSVSLADSEQDDILYKNLYVNTDENLDGTSLSVAVSRPASLVGVHSDYEIKFYNAEKQEILSPNSLLKCTAYFADGSISTIEDYSLSANATLYFKLKNSSYTQDKIYAVIFAIEGDGENQKASAIVCFNIVYGIKQITSINYDETQSLFSGNVCEDRLNLDCTTAEELSVVIGYEGVEGKETTIENLVVRSSDNSIVSAVQDENNKAKFYLLPLSAGDAIIELYATNLSTKYLIYVTSFVPVVSFYLTPSNAQFNSQTTSSNYDIGIADFVVDSYGMVEELLVSVGTQVPLRFVVSPKNASEYSVTYTVLKYNKFLGEYEQFDNNSKTYSYTELGTMISSGENIIADGEYFSYNCYNNSFLFLSQASAGTKYKIVVIINCTQKTLVRELVVSSYIPTGALVLDTTTDSLYNPSTISYEEKSYAKNHYTSLEESSTTIGLSIAQRANGTPTYSFEDYGVIFFKVNGEVKSSYRLSNGILTPIFENVVSLLSNIAENGKYWFELNAGYDFSSVKHIDIEIRLSGTYITKAISPCSYTKRIYVSNAEKVLSITSSTREEVYFEKGITPDQTFSINLSKESAYNKGISYLVLTRLNVGGKTYYALSDDAVHHTNNISVFGLTVTKQNDTGYLFTLSSYNSGESLIFVLPTDKLITSQDVEVFGNFSLTQVTFGEGDKFVPNVFYTDSFGTISATSCTIGSKYYVYSVDLLSIKNRWKSFAEVEVAVSDGIDFAYHISSIDDLANYIATEEGASRNYVLIKDISAQSISNWTPLANYYRIDTAGMNDKPIDAVKVSTNGSDFVNAGVLSFDNSYTYYGYGFNGTLSGLWNGKTHSIYGLSLSSNGEDQFGGLFLSLGTKALVKNLSISYSGAQVSTNNDYSFGGLAVTNFAGTMSNQNEVVYGVKDVKVSYPSSKSFSINSSGNITFGGVVAENRGIISNSSREDDLTISGNISFVVSSVKEILIGGICGANYGKIVGRFDYKTFSQNLITANLDISSTLNIVVSATTEVSSSNIGGVVAQNSGVIQNIAVAGNINAEMCDYVGGIAGSNLGNGNEEYSVIDCYSIVKVVGYNNVGGAFGFLSGKINYVSSENYYDDLYSANSSLRTFVSGNKFVGGFAGEMSSCEAEYCYTVSYYDLENDFACADVIGQDEVASFCGKMNNSILTACASKLFVKSSSDISNVYLFAGGDESNTLNSIYCNVVASGVYSSWINATFEDRNSICIYKNVEDNITYYYLNNDTSILENIKLYVVEDAYWKKDSNGMPYLFFTYNVGAEAKIIPLIFDGEMQIEVSVIDNSDLALSNYIFVDDDELVLFLSSQKGDNSSPINTINLFDGILSGSTTGQSYKTARVKLSSSNPSILTINSDGSVQILAEGYVEVTIYSILSPLYNEKIKIYVSKGLTTTSLFTNLALTDNANGANINLIKNNTQSLYSTVKYTRSVDGLETTFDAVSSVGNRFVVRNEENLDEIFKFSSYNWTTASDINGGYYYVDIDGSLPITINAIKATTNPICVEYTPYIISQFEVSKKIFVSSQKGFFDVSITQGATAIKLEGNSGGAFSIGQHQTIVFTVTIDTDYEDDDIDSNASSFASLDSNFSLVRSDNKVKTYDTNGNIKSISRTFTFNYKDKENSISSSNSEFLSGDKSQIVYILQSGRPLQFYPVSNPMNALTKDVTIVVNDKNSIDELASFVYSDMENDYPHTPSASGVVYNGKTALLSVEVYPYFSNYSKLRVSYSNANYSLVLAQVEYDIEATSGSHFKYYEKSGVIILSDDTLIVEKSSAQDTYIANQTNVYSYGKSYFFSIFAPSGVPNLTKFTVMVEVLDKNNVVISQKSIVITTMVSPSVMISFDKSLKGNDDCYYLPYNTTNKLDVNITNSSDEVSWQVSFEDNKYNANTQNMISIRDSLVPQKINGEYYLKVLNYESRDGNNVFETDLIGKKVNLTAVVGNQDVVSSPHTISFVITMFTIKGTSISGASDGKLNIQVSSISPLKVSLDLYYDENILSSSDNWYSYWYELYSNSKGGTLGDSISACGYEVQEDFENYKIILESLISKLEVVENTSSVFSYVDNTEKTITNLVLNAEFGNIVVDRYNDYFVLYCEKVDRSCVLREKISIDYFSSSSSGIPVASTLSKATMDFVEDFDVNFVYFSEFINPIPVSTAEEFLEMQEGKDYRLVKDIVLENYDPREGNFNSFDGNGYTIYITSFAYDENSQGNISLGLFSSVNVSSVVCNTTVYYTENTYLAQLLDPIGNVVTEIKPYNNALVLRLYSLSSFYFGGITATNNGMITNCTTKGMISISLNLSASETYPVAVSSALTAGLVCTNSQSGTITNSKVYDLTLSCSGTAGGFVGNNNGKVVASYFDNSSLSVTSNSNVGGFVYSNSGEILECFAQGKRMDVDTIQNTGEGVSSNGGDAAGFVYINSATISDCYSNMRFASSRYTSGFVFVDNASSVISRCYSISYKRAGDNTTTAFPFAGPVSGTRIEIQGTLNDCYYLSGLEYGNTNFYIKDSNNAGDTPANKKASPLSSENFMTDTYFANYDLSLSVTEEEVDGTICKVADGYTWVIIAGKPVLVSTLVDTLSNQIYLGKVKTYDYDESITYFAQGEEFVITDGLNFYLVENPEAEVPTGENPVYSRTDESNRWTYFFEKDGYCIQIVYNYEIDEESQEKYVADIVMCELKDTSISDWKNKDGLVLDWEEFLYDSTTGITEISSDKNFRANDTVEILRDKDGVIYEVKYKKTESVEYKYNITTGSRLNPNLIYSYDTFVQEFTKEVSKKEFYRLICNIDINSQFTTTSYYSFAGVLEGNHMSIDNIALSYTNISSENQNHRSFGLFSAITATVGDLDIETVISNLTLNVHHVVSHSHDFVGALAGQIYTNKENQNSKVFINNVSIDCADTSATGVFGVHSTGALAGIARGNVELKAVSSSISVTSYFEPSNSATSSLLYVNKYEEDGSVKVYDVDKYDKDSDEWIYSLDVSSLSYAGGIVGIFDVREVSNLSTDKNYGANNISLFGSPKVTGAICGSIFGLVGEDATVNYLNVYVPVVRDTYILALSYGGGLVGENRGKIYSSSISYEGEFESTISPLTAFSPYNYFYNLKSNMTIAIGGLVGFNNGGLISNSISTINVRNQYAKIAGGAVGRMAGGSLEYVVSAGAVLSSAIIGGLVGVASTGEDLVSLAFYNALAIVSGDQNLKFTSCVAENKYLPADYSYYYNILSSSSGKFAGFIGLVVNEEKSFDFITFNQKSYYVNTIYSSSGALSPACHIDSTYISKEMDSVKDSDSDPKTFIVDGEQKVIPYSTYEMYYDEDLNQHTTISYFLEVKQNNNEKPEDTNIPEDEIDDYWQQTVYKMVSSQPLSVKNYEEFYKEIEVDAFSSDGDKLYESLVRCYEYIYYINEGNYTLIPQNDKDAFKEIRNNNPDIKFYYISNPAISKFEYTKTYQTTTYADTNATYFSQDKVLFVGDSNNVSNQYRDCLESSLPFALDEGGLVDGLYSVTSQSEIESKVYFEKDGNYYAVLTNSSSYYIKDDEKIYFAPFGIRLDFDYYYSKYEKDNQTESEENGITIDITNLIHYIEDNNIDVESGSFVKTIKVYYDISNEKVNVYYGLEDTHAVASEFEVKVANGYESNFMKIKDAKSVYLNGFSFDVSNACIVFDIDNNKGHFVKSTGNFDPISLDAFLGEVIDISFTWIVSQASSQTYIYKINSVTLTYLFEDVKLTSNDDTSTITLNAKKQLNSLNTTYTLTFSARREVFKQAFDNGFWSFSTDFFASGSSLLNRYPINKNKSTTYVWTQFASPLNEDNHSIMNFAISSAEDLAALAKSVNLGVPYNTASSVITLTKDIDLSGKYWIPIGTKENPFKGTFDGAGHTIRYISANEKSNEQGEESLLDYAGLFGCVEDSTIKNLTILGGDIYGSVAGCVAGSAKNTKFINVVNKANVSGTTACGGIVGEADNCTFDGVVNYGSLSLETSSTKIINDSIAVYAGGVVGQAQSCTFTNEETQNADIANYGEITIQDSRTVYNETGKTLVYLYAGGIVGDSYNGSFYTPMTNSGKISVASSAHAFYIGGVAGRILTNNIAEALVRINTLSSLCNNGSAKIDFTYNNKLLDESEMTMSFLGGVVGQTTCSLALCKNEAQITFDQINSSKNYIVIGGVVGEANPDSVENYIYNNADDEDVTFYTISQTFNSGNMYVTSVSSNPTLCVGGVVGGANLVSAMLTSDLSDFYNTPSIRYSNVNMENCYNSGIIEVGSICKTYLGGIAGLAYFRYPNAKFFSAPNSADTSKEGDVSVLEQFGINISIEKCISIGTVHSQYYQNDVHFIGAIIASDEVHKTYVKEYNVDESSGTPIYTALNNYYLKASAYSGSVVFSASPKVEDGTFASAFTSIELKDKTKLEGFDFDDIWEQKYDTWYATLKENQVSSMWKDKTENISLTNNKYYITNAEQLSQFANMINSGSLYSVGLEVELASSIDLSGRFWTPIGNETYPFKGIFNGNMYVIRGLTIDGLYTEYGSLFGYTEDATIKNLGIESPIIMSVKYGASLVFSATNTHIEQVYTENGGSLSSVISATHESAGLVTRLVDSLGGLERSYNNVSVQATSSLSSIVGALVGTLDNSIISNSYNNYNGSLFASSGEVNETCLIAGKVVGENSYVFNVFSLAHSLNGSDCASIMFGWNSENGSIEILNGVEPTYDNLSTDRGDISSIWTNGYSLNQDEVKDFPSLIGMNKEWKNDASDSLLKVIVDDFGGNYALLVNTSKNSTGAAHITTLSNMYKLTSIREIYFISSAEDLAHLAQKVNSGINTQNQEYVLTRDIDLSGKYWTPIGKNSENAFKGVFNFNGYTISGIRIDSNSLSYAGLFGYTIGATISNGYIDDSMIIVQSNLNQTKTFVGALVGFAQNTTIKNMYVRARVIGIAKSSIYVGGVCGAMIGSKYAVENVVIDVPVKEILSIQGYESYIKELDSTIENSKIGVLAVSTNQNAFAGALAGDLEGSSYEVSEREDYVQVSRINSMTNVCAINALYSNAYVGGIIGYVQNYVTLSYCVNEGYVKGYAYTQDYVGGIAGYSSKVNLINCSISESGYVEGSLPRSTDNVAWSMVGGIAGLMDYGLLYHCVNNGSTYENYDSIESTSLGGIIGRTRNKYVDTTDSRIADTLSCAFASERTGFSEGVGVGYYDNRIKPENDDRYRDYDEYMYDISTSVPSLFMMDEKDVYGTDWQNEGELHSNSILIVLDDAFEFKKVGEESQIYLSSTDEDSLKNIEFNVRSSVEKLKINTYKVNEIGDKLSFDNSIGEISNLASVIDVANEKFLSVSSYISLSEELLKKAVVVFIDYEKWD